MYTLLIIDDENDIRENIKEIFELTGYKVFTAATGREGIKLAPEINPDLILCDIAMQGFDGFEVKQVLDQQKETSSIPFIYLTAQADFQNMRRGMNLGADDYITKPVRAKEIIDIVNKRLKRIEELKNISAIKRDKKNLTLDEIIPIKTGKELILIELKNIVAIIVSGDYTKVIKNDSKKLIIKKTLKEWEKLLPEKYFIRVHRKMIINLNYIEKIEPWFNGSLAAKVKGFSEIVKFSKRYSQAFKKKIKKN